MFKEFVECFCWGCWFTLLWTAWMLFWDWDTKHFESSRQMSLFEELEDAAVSGGDEIQSFDALPAHVFHSLQLGWSLSPRDVSMFQAIWWWYEPNHGVNHGECCVLPFKHLDALGSWQLTSKGKRPAFWGMPCCGWFLFLESMMWDVNKRTVSAMSPTSTAIWRILGYVQYHTRSRSTLLNFEIEAPQKGAECKAGVP